MAVLLPWLHGGGMCFDMLLASHAAFLPLSSAWPFFRAPGAAAWAVKPVVFMYTLIRGTSLTLSAASGVTSGCLLSFACLLCPPGRCCRLLRALAAAFDGARAAAGGDDRALSMRPRFWLRASSPKLLLLQSRLRPGGGFSGHVPAAFCRRRVFWL